MLSENSLNLKGVPKNNVVMRWSSGAGVGLADCEISDNYAQKAVGQRLTLTYDISGDTELNFEIALERME
jgi:hypothetical protein